MNPLADTAMFLLAQVPPQDNAPIATRSLLEYIHAGGSIGYVIILLSLIGLGLIIAQFIFLQRQRLAPPEQVQSLDQMLQSGRIRDAIAYCRSDEHDSFLTRVIGAALERCTRSSFGFLELRTALEEAGQHEVARLQRATDGIGLIAAIAPMLGLLGTVVGMVGAFETISVTEGTARPGQLAGSISVALITTVQGLIVAIPCTAAYTFLRNRIDEVASRIAETIEGLAAHLEQGGAEPAQGVPSRAAAPGARPVSVREPRTA